MIREDVRALLGDRAGRDSRLLRRFSLAASRETSLVGGSGGGKSGDLRLVIIRSPVLDASMPRTAACISRHRFFGSG
jgi:hypothetical protein